MKRIVWIMLCMMFAVWAFPVNAQNLAVTSMTPADGSVSVSQSTTIAIEFNKDLQDVSIGVDFDEVLMMIPEPMNERMAVSIDGNTLSINAELAEDQVYQVIVAGKVLRGTDNSTLSKALVIAGTFTTGASLPTGSISGTVTPYYPFSDAPGYVIAYNPTFSPMDHPVRIAEVNAVGTYSLPHLLDGTYLLSANQFRGLDTEEGFSTRRAESITVENGQAAAGGDITMSQLEVVSSVPEDGAVNVSTATTVSVTFNEALYTEDGVPDFDVEFFPQVESGSEPVVSEDGKTVSVDVELASDTVYKMGIFAARGASGSRIIDPVYISFSTGATLPSGSITGNITNLIQLAPSGRIVAGIIRESGKIGSPVNVASDGSYTISNLNGGSYYVFATTVGDYQEREMELEPDGTVDTRNMPYISYYGWDGTGADTPDPVTVTDGEAVSGIDMALAGETVVKLLDYSPEDGATGISSSEASLSFTFNLPLNSDVEDEDEFEYFFSHSMRLNVVPSPGGEGPPRPVFSDFGRTVTLTAEMSGNTYYTAIVTGARDVLGEELPEANASFDNPTAFGFTTGNRLPDGSVSGTVRIPDSGIEYAMVILHDVASAGSESGDSEDNWKSVALVNPDDGSYSMKAADGTYYPIAMARVGDRYLDQWIRAAYDPDGDGTPDTIEITGGAVSGIDINLAVKSLIGVSGIVRSETKKPVARAYVEIYDEESDYWNSVTTNTGGAFQFKNVPTGTYTVRVNPPEGVQLDYRELIIRVINKNVSLNITLLSTGLHYRYAEDTGESYSIQIQDAKLDGMSLAIGDEIAVIAAKEYDSAGNGDDKGKDDGDDKGKDDNDDDSGKDNGDDTGKDDNGDDKGKDNGDRGQNSGLMKSGSDDDISRAVRRGEVVVGAAVFDGSYPVQITAWKDNPATVSKDGYADGDKINFEIWRKSSNSEMSARATYGVGDGTFGSGTGTVITLLEANRKNLGEFVREVVSSLQERVKVTFDDNSAVAVRFRTGDAAGKELTMRGIGTQLADTIKARIRDTLKTVAGYYEIQTSLSDTFSADLSIEYTEEMLTQAGINENNIILAWYDSTARRWKSVPTEVDVVNRIATALTSHFSLWALTDSTDEIITDVEDVDVVQNVPAAFTLMQNYPNPFNPVTTIRYELQNTARVNLTIYNILGQRVRSLVEGQLPPGAYSVQWDGRADTGVSVSSGVYFYRLEAGQFIQTRKMILLR